MLCYVLSQYLVAGINKRRGLAFEFLMCLASYWRWSSRIAGQLRVRLLVLDGRTRSAKLSGGLPSGLILSGLSQKAINAPIYTFLITPLRTGQYR
jgi:hypothetical protein